MSQPTYCRSVCSGIVVHNIAAISEAAAELSQHCLNSFSWLLPDPPACCTTSTRLLQIAITALHLSRHVTSGYVSIACSVQCILLLLRWGECDKCNVPQRKGFVFELGRGCIISY